MWYNGDSDAASLNPALNAAMLINQYLPLVDDSKKAHSYLVSISFVSPRFSSANATFSGRISPQNNSTTRSVQTLCQCPTL